MDMRGKNAAIEARLAASILMSVVALVGAGCASVGESPAQRSEASPPSTVASESSTPAVTAIGPDAYRVDLDGLIVTLETTATPPSGDTWLQESVVRLPEPSAGNRLLYARLTVENSTETTISAMVPHNAPELLDTQDRTVPLLFPRSFRGNPNRVISPHGSSVAVVTYDVPPERQTYTMTWTLSNERALEISFDWP